MVDKAKIEKLKKKIAETDDPDVREALTEQLAGLTGEDWLTTEIPQADYEEAADRPEFVSTFPVKGDWVAVFGKPYLYTKEGEDEANTFCFPFHVPAEGYTVPFEERDDRIWAAFRLAEGAKSLKLKGILNALGVPTDTTEDGLVRFKASDVEGKVGKVLYRVPQGQTYYDAVTGEEKQSTIARPVAVVPLEAEGEPSDIPF